MLVFLVCMLAEHLYLFAQQSFSPLCPLFDFRKEVPRCNTYHPKAITCLAKLPKQSLVSHVMPSIMLSIVRRGCAPGVEVRIAAYVESSMQRYWLDKVGGFSLVPHATLTPFWYTCSCLNVTHPHMHTHRHSLSLSLTHKSFCLAASNGHYVDTGNDIVQICGIVMGNRAKLVLKLEEVCFSIPGTHFS